MSELLIDKDPTRGEMEKLRLVLSTYQDGSGQQATNNGQTLPGWRDFERAVALVFRGTAQENKFIFDVLVPETKPTICVGISCKMRRTLNDTLRNGRVTLELSNSSGKFWRELEQLGINHQNYKGDPNRVGASLIAVINKWHHEVSIDSGGIVDLQNSYYFAFSWNKSGHYQLFKFPLELPNPANLDWDFPNVSEKGGIERPGRRLRGRDTRGTIFEWYGESGGQLKYYPLVENALWKSEIFQLEKLPNDWAKYHGILIKAKDYFPESWTSIIEEEDENENE